MVRIGGIHARNARRWMIDQCGISTYDPATSTWGDPVATRCVVQQPTRQGSYSSPDPGLASVEEMADIVVYCDPATTAQVGDRLHWEGEIYTVAQAGNRRTETPYVRLACSIMQSALQPVEVEFHRVQYDADGRITGRITIGPYMGRFTSGITIGGVDDQDGAQGAHAEARGILPPDATDLRIGDWFVLDAMPARITGIDTSAADHVEIEYTVERAVP